LPRDSCIRVGGVSLTFKPPWLRNPRKEKSAVRRSFPCSGFLRHPREGEGRRVGGHFYSVGISVNRFGLSQFRHAPRDLVATESAHQLRHFPPPGCSATAEAWSALDTSSGTRWASIVSAERSAPHALSTGLSRTDPAEFGLFPECWEHWKIRQCGFGYPDRWFCFVLDQGVSSSSR